ncbi:uncharacterized protein [Narcine bancroftii]|uniref:uncharacterized protein n=1 Tax=Narcine bancroftii TaxID=1343680 RepID=UPI0038318579
MTPETLANFDRDVVESVLTGCIMVWYGDTNTPENKALQKVVDTAHDITDKTLPTIEFIDREWCCQKTSAITKDPHSLFLFSLLPSGKNSRCLKTQTPRFRNSCSPSTFRLLNNKLNQELISGPLQHFIDFLCFQFFYLSRFPLNRLFLHDPFVVIRPCPQKKGNLRVGCDVEYVLCQSMGNLQIFNLGANQPLLSKLQIARAVKCCHRLFTLSTACMKQGRERDLGIIPPPGVRTRELQGDTEECVGAEMVYGQPIRTPWGTKPAPSVGMDNGG